MNPQTDQYERLITMAERLANALAADIEVLKAGRPQEMASLDPEIQRLSMLYAREVQGFDPVRAKAMPEPVKKRLAAATRKFRETLNMHQRLLTRIRNATEGLVKAVADEVQRQRAPTITYAPPKAKPRPSHVPMLFDGVV